MRIAILDPAAGISGDMTLGALLALGVPQNWLEALPGRLGFEGVAVTVRNAVRCGVECKQVEFTIPERAHGRHVGELVRVVERAPVSDWVKERAVQAFQLVGDAEGRVHGVAPEKVHLHEVGAVEAEATTPTGAALVRVLAAGPPPGQWRMLKSGWGAGQRNPKHYPNALRILFAEQAAEAGRVALLATDVDDMSPEYVEPLRQALVAAGALDVQTWPVQMKKGRSGFRVEVVAPEDVAEAVTAALFRHSTTAGGRRPWGGARRHAGAADLAARRVRHQAGPPAREQRHAVAEERVQHEVCGSAHQGPEGRRARPHAGGDDRKPGEESRRLVLPGPV